MEKQLWLETVFNQNNSSYLDLRLQGTDPGFCFSHQSLSGRFAEMLLCWDVVQYNTVSYTLISMEGEGTGHCMLGFYMCLTAT